VSDHEPHRPPLPRNVIPLPLITGDRAVAARRGADLRAAVVQVITDLVIRRVPPAERLPQFAAARDLLEEAGRSLAELVDAAEPGPEQESLFETLGI
jgi:hypothetical protein